MSIDGFGVPNRPGASGPTFIDAEALETIRSHGAETFPHECCGALIAVEGRVVEAFRLDNTTGGGAARDSGSVPTVTGRRRRVRRRAGARSSVSITRTPTSPRGHRRTIWSTPGRISRMSSFQSGPARQVTSRRGICAMTGPDSTRES